MKRTSLLVLFLMFVCAVGIAARQNGPWKAVDDAMGRQGQDQPDGAHRFNMPRSDLKVTANGVEIKPGFALGSWAAFQMMGNHSDVMGDLVLSDNEVGPVMQKLVDSGIEITALHNHLLNESPQIMYMHIHGQGDAVKLASSLRAALALTKTPTAAPAPSSPPPDLGFDSKQLDTILGQTGRNNNGIYQYSIGRAEKIVDGGMTVPNSMGVATGINFQPTGGGKAAITGDFVMIGREVNPVIKALRQSGIEVTALHSHMLDEQPRLFFMHFWANDDALKLARGLRAALDQTNSAKQK
jgi:biotin operon repressor